MKLWQRIGTVSVIATLLAGGLPQPQAEAVSTTSKLIYLYVDSKEAYVNGQKFLLDAPATVMKGTTYVPIKFLGDQLGFKVTYNTAKKMTEILAGSTVVQLDFARKVAYENGMPVPLDTVATIDKNQRTLLRVKQMARYLKIKEPAYNATLKRIELSFVPPTEGLYDPDKKNSRPVAKFTFGKSVYRKGEPIEYVDLSYDSDGDPISFYTWTGKKEAFFEAGTYQVTLKVTDRTGLVSNDYTRSITISDETYLTPEQFALQMRKPGSYIADEEFPELFASLRKAEYAQKTVENDNTRPLLFSDSPETYTQKGILYQDQINGNARLYAHHINGMSERTKFAIYLTNNSDQEVQLKTTNKGEAYPSSNPALVGHVAAMDFLLHDPLDEQITVAPGETLLYKELPTFFPQMGMNSIYDVETTGPLTATFAAVDLTAGPESITNGTYQPLNRSIHVRGTFPYSDSHWYLDGNTMNGATRVSIADGTTDPFASGTDVLTGTPATNKGSFGVVYNLHIENPKKMAILFIARAGGYKGSVKINGKIVQVPQSGILTPLDKYMLLERTKGTEGTLDIELMPPAGSNLPVDMVFYPLDEVTQQ
ncbi:stalk domain-containing protein [Paenibacillus gansuensis]|uniref:Stalk domain-containing protein n=1 Tax=Paenibacillus gansuensis TaxID=306542 RepID=A0ABW5PF39_9BACL